MIRKYNKQQTISYAIGVYPTLELLSRYSETVVRVYINPKGERNTGVSKILEICKKYNIPTESNQKFIEQISQSENTYALAVFKKYKVDVGRENCHVMLVNPSDAGNLGTICRTMLAFGFFDLAIIKPAVDIFDPKVIRASMGAVFGLRFSYYSSFDEYRKTTKHHLYPFMCDGKKLLTKAEFEKPYSLIFGNEGEGLNQEYMEIGQSIKIPQSSQVDSLNLAVAVGIALYQTS